MKIVKFIRYLRSFTSKYFVRIELSFLFLLLLGPLIVSHPNIPIEPKTTLLYRIDSVHASPIESFKHNTQIINFLEERRISVANLILSRDEISMSARIFYAAILAGLMSLFFFSRSEKTFGRWNNILSFNCINVSN